ncbi:MAG: transposase [Phycisphaeraceae bacterium]
MPRRPRQCPPGHVYHVLNRGVGRMTLFEDEADYAAFERVLMRTRERVPEVELFAWCLMPNHWHLLVRPKRAGGPGALSEFMRLLTVTHSQRWHAHRRSAGTGPLYQGRFKSFPMQTEGHFLTVARYVERNPLRAGLVGSGRAQDWRWSSLAARRARGEAERQALLSPWPVRGEPGRPGVGRWREPRGWLAKVNRAESPAELEALRLSVQRGRPYGDEAWVEKVAAKLDLGSTLRPRGRPRKQ